MHLGGNRRQVPLTNEALSIIIYVKISRYAMLRRIKRCKRVLYLDRPSQDEKNKNLFQNKKLKIENLLGKQRSDTGGLDCETSVKETTRVMLTTNIDIADRLINGQLSTIMRIYVSLRTQKPTIIYIKFDDSKAGKKNLTTKSNNQFAKKIILDQLSQY